MAAPAIRELVTPEEFAACVALQEQVWRFDARDLVPARIFIVARKIGGQTLGAWAGGRLAGFSLALPALRDGEAFWHSHMLAVAPGYRNSGVGRALKLRQRQEALARGLDRMEWTFDPLEIKNGYFNLEVLGATARRYHPNLYGLTSSALQAGLPTDRLTAEWRLRSPRVERRAKATTGEPAPNDGQQRDVIMLRIIVPGAVQAWKEAGDPRALELQRRNRELFLDAFGRGLQVIGYERGEGSPPDGTFLVGQSEPAP